MVSTYTELENFWPRKEKKCVHASNHELKAGPPRLPRSPPSGDWYLSRLPRLPCPRPLPRCPARQPRPPRPRLSRQPRLPRCPPRLPRCPLPGDWYLVRLPRCPCLEAPDRCQTRRCLPRSSCPEAPRCPPR